ncbi:proline dehydrogenase [Lignoscripta atroalba]|nr:proline dehydrogenase [Lignoscripta atroalba]
MSPYRSLKVLDHHRHVFNIVFQTQKRWLHYSLARQAVTTTASSSSSPPNVPAPPISDILTRKQPVKPPLSLLPFTSLVRSYLIASISSSPALLSLCLRLFSTLARSPSPILNPDRNPILRYLVKKTFYAQYCAGETSNEVERTISDLRKVGYEGVILAYAREFDVSAGQLGTAETKNATEANGEIEAWKKGTLETVSLASKGDFVALKFTGAGSQALHLLARELPPNEEIEQATTEICELAKARGVPLLFDAEQQSLQHGIDAWTLEFQKRYNSDAPGHALVHGTYQTYLRSIPATLARHLAAAKDKGFTLGVKLVRGAYMGSDPRHLFWSKKEDTDKVYNSIVEAVLRRRYGGVLVPLHGTEEKGFPEVNLVLASHNHETVKKALAIRQKQLEEKEGRINLVYGQLMGMADEVSCELVQAGKHGKHLEESGIKRTDVPKAYKYLVWGSVSECLKYLLRRAEENRDAFERTKGSRLALRAELGRRVFGS